jgi:[acyl-carrier-protein] S-malonyltransferase
LTQTGNLQPALTAVNLACLAAIQKEGLSPDVSAGHSLGEYSALYAAGIISREDAVRLVIKRGELMHREATRHPGAMHALVGLSMDTVGQIVSKVRTEGPVSVANHNTELQIVNHRLPRVRWKRCRPLPKKKAPRPSP